MICRRRHPAEYTPRCSRLSRRELFTDVMNIDILRLEGGSVAEWLACWTQAQKGPGSNRSRDAVG